MIDTDEFLELESSSDQTISDILLEHEINSSDVAAAFYLLRKSEKISAGKLLVYQNAAGELRFNRDVPLPVFRGRFPVAVKPSDVPAGSRLFVQSTSPNRGIKANEHVLVKFATKRVSATSAGASDEQCWHQTCARRLVRWIVQGSARRPLRRVARSSDGRRV